MQDLFWCDIVVFQTKNFFNDAIKNTGNWPDDPAVLPVICQEAVA